MPLSGCPLGGNLDMVVVMACIFAALWFRLSSNTTLTTLWCPLPRSRRITGLHQRAEFLHVKPGKGAAFVRSKLKNYVTGNTVERTFRAGESVGTADIDRIDTQFTYGEGDTVRRRDDWVWFGLGWGWGWVR